MSPPDDCYLVVAKWEPDGRVEVWRGGVFDTYQHALDRWAEFEADCGGGTLVAVLRVDLTGAAIAPFFDVSINFQWK